LRKIWIKYLWIYIPFQPKSILFDLDLWNLSFHIAAVILWNEMRQQWVANRPAKKAKRVADPVLRYIFLMVSLAGLIYFFILVLILLKKMFCSNRSNTSDESLHSLSQRIPLPVSIHFIFFRKHSIQKSLKRYRCVT